MQMMGIFFGRVSGKVCSFHLLLAHVHSSSYTSTSALGNSKGPFISCGIMLTRELNCASIPADIIKMIESQPELAGQIRRVRGGYLKIQGTWMPYEVRAYFIAIICARLTFTSTGRTPTSSSVCRALTYLRTTRFDYVPL